MMIVPQTAAAVHGYLLREGVVLNLPDDVADRLIQSGHALPYTEPAPDSNAASTPVQTPSKRSKKEV